MDLAQYRRTEGLSLDQLAEKLGIRGVNPARTVQRYETFERIPDRATMRLIESATGGLVRADDFPDRPTPRPTPAQDAA